MIVIRQRCAYHQGQAQLVLPFELRQKRRLQAHLDSGEAVRIVLAHSHVLRHGDCLLADDGRVIQVIAAPEPVLTATTTDPRLLARAAYHLGNRHAPVQLGIDWLRILDDPVLAGMLRQLGLTVQAQTAPFEPEAGAYSGHPPGAQVSGHSQGTIHEFGNGKP